MKRIFNDDLSVGELKAYIQDIKRRDNRNFITMMIIMDILFIIAIGGTIAFFKMQKCKNQDSTQDDEDFIV